MDNKRDCLCPVCGKRVARLADGAHCKGVWVWCRLCKKEVELVIDERDKQN